MYRKLILLFLLSFLVIGAASAADADMDVASPEIDEVSVDDVQAIDNDLKTKEVLSDDAPQEESVVSVATKDTPYNENATIDVSVAKTAITNNSSLKLFIDREEKGNLTLDEEGKASYTIPAKTFDAGKYFIQAVLDDGSSKVAGMSTLNITKVTPVISVPDVTEKSGNVITIPFNVTDDKGEIVGGEVFISIYWENDYISKYIDLGNGSTSEFDIASIIGIFSRNSTGNSSNGTGIADLLNRNSTNSS